MFEIPRSERDATTSEHFIIWSSIRVQKYDTNTKRRGANFCQIQTIFLLFVFIIVHSVHRLHATVLLIKLYYNTRLVREHFNR